MPESAILHVNVGGGRMDRRYRLTLGGREFEVHQVGLKRDLRQLERMLAEAPEQRVAISGVTLNYRFNGVDYQHRGLARRLKPLLRGREYSDGAAVKRTLERYLVDRAIARLAVNFRDKRILVFSAVSRYDAAEVLAAQSRRIVFGDLLYGFRLGVPLTSVAALKKAAPAVLRAVVSTPAWWFSPGARPFGRRMPRFRWYFHWAEVIFGGMSYFRRYSPPALPGKIVFTNLRSEEDVEFLRGRGVATAVGLLPLMDGRRVSTSVLELMLREVLRDEIAAAEGDLDTAILNHFVREELEPEIIDFEREPDVDPGLIEQAVDLPLPAPVREPARAAPAGDDEGRFAFVIHPLVYDHLKKNPALRFLDRFLPQFWVERIAAQIPPYICARVENIVSATGARATGYIYGLPLTSRGLLNSPPERVYRRLNRITRHAARIGVGIVGLGAFTSVVGDAGLTVSRRSPIGVTTGNSFTVAVTIRTLARAAELMGIDPKNCEACVVGASGSIGSVLSHLLASEVPALTLVSPRPERLLALSHSIRERFPRVELRVARRASEAIGTADIIITTTSAVEPVVRMEWVKPGAVICDVARPPDISPDAAAQRPDVLVIESGEGQLFPGARVTMNLGLPEGVIYACLAETMLLGLERHYDHFTIGRNIEEDRIRQINDLADKHGMKLAAIRSFGRELSEEDIIAVRDLARLKLREQRAGRA